jgi:hypothetical protein
LTDFVGITAIALLTLEAVLVVLTIFVIFLAKREASARLDLVDKLMAAVRILTREEYFAMTVEALQEAKESVEGVVTGSRPGEADSTVVDRILRAIEQAVARGVSVRYLLPLGAERLHMGHRYEASGAKVRYHPGLLVGDARYMIVDNRAVVLGFPERPGEEEPTRRGQRVYSEATARLFREGFEAKWSSSEAIDHRAYLQTVVGDVVRSNPGISAERIGQDLEVPVEDVERALKAFTQG